MKIRHLRWWIAALLLIISIKNYADRQMLPILAPSIQAELHVSDQQYAGILNLFLAAYTASYLISGRLVDAWGSRVSLALFLGLWSVAGALTGWARSAVSLGWLRFVFGLGEAGGYTASPKVVSEWFPQSERGVAISLYSMGGAIGATVAPLATIALANWLGWRRAMIVAGAAGLAVIVPWLVFFRKPARHPWLTDAERGLIEAGQTATAAPLPEAQRWKLIVGSPAIWALMVSRMLTDPVWYFFQFWMPKYLHVARGLSQAQLGLMWVIFLAADFGFFGGGWASDRLVRHGRSGASARLRVMLVCAVVMPLAALIAPMPQLAGVMAISMVIVLAHTAWLTNHNALVMDVVPAPIFGTAYGLISAGSAVGGILMNQAVVWTVGAYSYDRCFYAMMVLHPLAFALVWRFARRPWTLPSPGLAIA